MLTVPHLKEDGEKADYHFLSRIINHQKPAIEIPPYYLPQTSATRLSHNPRHILPPSNTQSY